MRIRPVRMSDHDKLLELAGRAGFGMTSLPPDPEVLDAFIHRSEQSFANDPDVSGVEKFLLVMEDEEAGVLAGTCGITAHIGLRKPFYSYKVSTIAQASQVADVYSSQQVLVMVNDYTGASELIALFLNPDYRKDGLGKILSRSRYLMLAEFPDLFADVVIAEVRGVHDENGDSPFYDNLAKHFFQMDFHEADYMNATQGNQFISDLMPRHPIYVNLLKKRAQAVIGEPFEASRPAKALLEKEGFRYKNYVDVFDGGPTLEADRKQIRSIKNSHHVEVLGIQEEIHSQRFIISNTQLKNFCVVRGHVAVEEDGVMIDAKAAGQLDVKAGEHVRYIEE
jgi:arginine N-succinyltransferase